MQETLFDVEEYIEEGDLVLQIPDDMSDEDAEYIKQVLEDSDIVSDRVVKDIGHQVNKFGAQRLDGNAWNAVIAEEWGETVADYNKKNYDNCIAEAHQTIACISRFISEVKREQSGKSRYEQSLYQRQQ